MRRMNYLLVVCAVAVCSVFCDKANAEEHKHDGFFLRLAPGIGVASSSETIGANKIENSGTSGFFNFAIGGAVTENFIVHLDLSSATVSDPKLKVNGESVKSTNNDNSTSILGLGLTYYFPSNIYVTGAVGTARTEIKSNGDTFSTDRGYGVNLMLGKEWWVSENWGLGVAGQFLYTKCPDKPVSGDTSDVKTTAFGVLFSATYN